MLLDTLAVVVSILALLFSAVAFSLARQQERLLAASERRLQDSVFFADRNTAFEQRLADWPDALEFHGIDKDLLEADGLTIEQVVYLVLSTNALVGTCKSLAVTVYDYIHSSSYRKLMYEQPATRCAWKYARRLFSSEYREGVDRYLHEVYGEPLKVFDD